MGAPLPAGAGTGPGLEAAGAVPDPMLPLRIGDIIGRGDINGPSCLAPWAIVPRVMELVPAMPARCAPIAVAVLRQTYRPWVVFP
ncbi:MAG: hypothetical protein GIX03_15620 [Candidatus Eremiobacteraeota bacterium]|nr:hypothetical protein [Candidatus Eremiobacteraeota bacterium]MBC5804393.1 hypothetical protein [Candidatus Eremiobacteraeota bacterium]MBC5821146.1 hypothetical protein [Candidatus Eremiobacteraeota bacterium]